MEFTIDEVKKAYIKLKSNNYYDNSSLFLRKQIAEFENNIDNNLESIVNELNNLLKSDENYMSKIQKELKKYINIKYLPKKIEDAHKEENIINNYENNGYYNISRIMLIIDMPVKFHILGVLWILSIGKKIDNDLPENIYANRLKNIDSSKCKIDLFKRYYDQYNLWRDDALEEIEYLISKEKEVIVLCLDIKDYYYSVDIKLKDLEEDILSIYPQFKEDKKSKVLNDYIYEIIKNYSEKVMKKPEKTMLPIGFLPSNIIANWYLKKFDNKILNKLNPAYYGRYVDDILIVIPQYYTDKLKSSEDIIDKYLIKDTEILEGIGYKTSFKEYLIRYLDTKLYDEIIEILEKNSNWIKSSNKQTIKKELKYNKIESLSDKIDFIFYLYNIIKKTNIDEFEKSVKKCNDDFEKYRITDFELYIQKNKMKIYNLSPKGSKAIIENFKANIQKNSSEFRYLPLEDDIIKDFNQEVYQLEYSDTINKIRSIDDIKVSKFELSKYLAKILFIHKFNLETDNDKTSNQINTLFQHNKSIEFYSLWEKVFTYLLFKRKNDNLRNFIKNLLDCIDKIKLDIENAPEYCKHINSELIKRDLKEYLIISLAMTMSLHIKGNKYIQYFIKEKLEGRFKELKINVHEELYNTALNIKNANLFRHNYIYYPLINYCNIIKNKDNNDVDLLQYNFRCRKIGNEITKKCDKTKCKVCEFELNTSLLEYSPRFIHLYEFILHNINMKIAKSKIVGEVSEILEAYECFCDVNFYNERNSKNELNNSMFKILNADDKSQDATKFNNIIVNEIKIKNDKKDKLKIGLANIKVYDYDIKSSYLKKPNINIERLKRIFNIINSAKSENVDILVFPEVSIPYMLLKTLAYEAMKNDIAIVCGLEHLVYEDENACNYLATILPIKNNKNYVSSLVKLRLKNHYSPEEEKILKGNSWKIPKNNKKYYDLFNWKGVSFSCYNCFELCSIEDRCIFKSYVDLIISSVFNKDTKYFSNIAESITRDIHCYFVQVNSSNYGDSRIIKPASKYKKDILRIKGGENSTILIGEIDIENLRQFQILDHILQKDNGSFKPTPPEFDIRNVKDRLKLP
ncbi:hypothetical protein CF098_01430 [Clostridium sporogenes]|uniref:nitrilase-related carbon-nitrogen hydrolase n=1 Tax=Clostridium sporogenes TaxID=1509 RepID=UPI0005EE8EBB|nr:nitrilase-related carbon-nitrogen hydrolase [Clostridium sporogenes]